MTKLEELKAALEAATPGEWHQKSWHKGAVLDGEGRMVAAAYVPNDARVIALAHNLMPQLLEAVRWADATREWVEACFPEYADVEVINELKQVLEKLK